MTYPAPYPYTFYVPHPVTVTHINKTFPEHHFPLEHTRHGIAQGLRDFFNDTMPAPRADVRETLNSYFIDVEIPGVESKEAVMLKWTDDRTLLLEVAKKAKDIVEEIDESKAALKGDAGSQMKEATEKSPQSNVHHLVKERDLGKLVREFYFRTDINHDAMTTLLRNGVLEMVIPKSTETKAHKLVEVRHEPASPPMEIVHQ